MYTLEQILASNEIMDFYNGLGGMSFVGAEKFPTVKQYGLDISFIKGANNEPIVLQPSTFDAKAPLRDRITVDRLDAELPFFREGMILTEREKRELESLLARGVEFAENLIRRIYNDRANLIKGALVQQERMRMALLMTGGISIVASDENGQPVGYTYNYDEDGTWSANNTVTLSGTDMWTDVANATPIEDIQNAILQLAEQGVVAQEILMNTVTLRTILATDEVATQTTGMLFLSKKEWLQEQLGLTLVIEDRTFKNENKVSEKFFKDGYVTIMPSGQLGETVMSYTPEEMDLMNKADVDVSVVETGVAVLQYVTNHPVQHHTIVSEIVLPSFERMNEVFVIKGF